MKHYAEYLNETNVVHAGKSGISSQIIVAIVVPIVVSLMLFIIGVCFLVRKAKKKNYHTVMEES
ncbi:unnamed protein product, partial [Ilex paraguariensis]